MAVPPVCAIGVPQRADIGKHWLFDSVFAIF
ncbi:MAG: hypothetical protein ACI8R4_003408 [Paracoccaceae bacterium]|jgi:hypothetical protein